MNQLISNPCIVHNLLPTPASIPSLATSVAKLVKTFAKALKKARRFIGLWKALERLKDRIMKRAPMRERMDDTRMATVNAWILEADHSKVCGKVEFGDCMMELTVAARKGGRKR